jgi:alanine racemase
MDDIKNLRPVWLEINLDNLVSNINGIKSIVDKDTMIMAVIKANGYGHGSVELAKMYKELGVERIATSIVTEAVELRKAGIKGPIHLLSYTPKEQLDLVVDYDIIQGIYNYNDAVELSKAAADKGKVVQIHLKIDSGMGRIGFLPNDDSIYEIVRISKLPNIEIEGAFTHFAKADETDKSFTRTQYERYQWVIGRLENEGINIKVKHVSNSAAIIDLPEYNLDMVRPGIILYGYYPSEEVNKDRISLKPAMTLKGKISNIKKVSKDTGISYGHIYHTSKDSVIATIPIGYADGYSRMLSGKGFVYIKGKRVPIVGRICMDQLMIDVTDIDDIQIGDEAVLFGVGNDDYPKVEEIAALLGTINYELICMMGRRIPRIYIRNNKIVDIKDCLLD